MSAISRCTCGQLLFNDQDSRLHRGRCDGERRELEDGQAVIRRRIEERKRLREQQLQDAAAAGSAPKRPRLSYAASVQRPDAPRPPTPPPHIPSAASPDAHDTTRDPPHDNLNSGHELDPPMFPPEGNNGPGSASVRIYGTC